MNFVVPRFPRWLPANAAVALMATCAMAQPADVKALVEQNRQLLEQVRTQQKQIDELRVRLDRMEGGTAPASSPAAASGRQIRLSAEVGVGYFDSGANGSRPNAEFRVDDARVFIEAAVWRNVYFFGGLEITTREASDEFFHAGEIYADVEDLLSSGREFTLSLRAGRFNVPFGEEYQVRNVMDNPLISHSLADIWGIDEGVQIYGTLGPVRYNLAVQNGSHPSLRDFDSDKSWAARLAWDASTRLTLSASALRTGDLTVAGDEVSEVWFANAFFRAIGPAATTRLFGAELVELDAAWRWTGGHLKASAGWVSFDDDDSAADNSREIRYHSLETLQRLAGNLHLAARYSAIDAPRGYPLAGQGRAGRYFYNPLAPLTKDLQRLSLGLNYRFGPPLVWKLEYSWEDGSLVNGTARTDSDMLSSLLGLRF